MATGESLSVVIPSWREGARLLQAIRAVRLALGKGEIVVAAREEAADIRDCARAEGVVWIDCPEANRGLQLALGASRARGTQLVFLHADSRLPVDSGRLIRGALASPHVCGGAFRLRFDQRHPVLDSLSWLSRLTLPTAFLGDQCLFCTREAYDAAGGFRPEPLFEDVDIACRLARVGKLVRLRESVTTSARRFMERGPLRQVVTNGLLMLAFHAGVSPRSLVPVYAPLKGIPPAAGVARTPRHPASQSGRRLRTRRTPERTS